jgi:Mg/Co/Ni transporter MgtE
MEKDEAEEVRDLLGFEQDTAGALMTTEYVVVGDEATVESATAALRYFEGPVETVNVVYIVDSHAVLVGAAPLGRILLAEPSTPLKVLSVGPVISVQAHADERSVVDLFHKYNLLSLPVVDEKGHLLGVITADDVLALAIRRE